MSNNENIVAALNTALQLFHTWNKNEIVYCHWKGNNHLIEGLHGDSDLDVLLSETCRNQAMRILSDLSYIHVTSQYGSAYRYVEDWVACDTESGKMIHVHLHYRIVSGHHGLKEYLLPFTEELLSSRILDDKWGIYIANPTLELLMLYTRIGIKIDYIGMIKARTGKYSITKHDLPEVLYLKEKYDNDMLGVLAKKYYGTTSNEILEIINRNTYDSKWMLDLHSIATRTFKRYNRTGLAQPFLRIYYRSAIMARHGIHKYIYSDLIIKKTLPKGNGVIAVFVGQDGAGKSTVTNEVIQWLTWKIDAKRFYFGSGDGYRSLVKALSDRLKGKTGILFGVRTILVILNFRKIAKKHLNLSKKMRKYVAKGGVAICDRYPQLQFAGINDGPNIRKLKEKTNNKYVHMILDWQADKEEADIKKTISILPDIVFKLVLPVEESMRRKPEENEESIIIKNKIINSLDFNSGNCVIVKADQDYDEEIALIHSALWKVLEEKARNIEYIEGEE